MQIHIPDFLECLSLLKDYNQHLANSCVLCSFSRNLAEAGGCRCSVSDEGKQYTQSDDNLRNGQNHASVSCIKQFQKQKCRFSFLRFSPEGRPVKMQVSTSLPRLDVDIR
jgi:hypothetical protein